MGSYPDQTRNQLGTRLAVYRPGTVKIMGLGILLILISLPCIIGGIKSDETPTVYDTSSDTIGGWLLAVGMGLALCGVISLILTFSNRKLRVDLYEQGFVATNKHGTKEIRWDQITHIWHKLEEIVSTVVKDSQTSESTYKTRKVSTDVYVMQSTDGAMWEIDTSIYGLNKFVPVLEQTYLRCRLPGVLATYQTGTPLVFGSLTVSSSGVNNTQQSGNGLLAWRSFNAIEVDKQKGDITTRSGVESRLWSTVSVTDTPDLTVFEALVNTIAGQLRM